VYSYAGDLRRCPPPRSSPRCLPLQLHEVPVTVRCGSLSRRGRVWYWRGRGCCGTLSWRRRVWCRRGRGEDPERYELRCEAGCRRCAVGGAGAQSCACRSRWRARRWWARRSARRCQQRSRHQPGVRRPVRRPRRSRRLDMPLLLLLRLVRRLPRPVRAASPCAAACWRRCERRPSCPSLPHLPHPCLPLLPLRPHSASLTYHRRQASQLVAVQSPVLVQGSTGRATACRSTPPPGPRALRRRLHVGPAALADESARPALHASVPPSPMSLPCSPHVGAGAALQFAPLVERLAALAAAGLVGGRAGWCRR